MIRPLVMYELVVFFLYPVAHFSAYFGDKHQIDESHHMQTSKGFRDIVGAVPALSGLLSANGGAKVRRGGAIYPQYSQTPEAAIEWAESIGASTSDVISYILDTYQSEKQALQSIFSLKKSERRYSKYEIERACKMVLSITKRPTVKSIQTMLKNNKKNDAEQELKSKTEINKNNYGFTRGAAYYGGTDE